MDDPLQGSPARSAIVTAVLPESSATQRRWWVEPSYSFHKNFGNKKYKFCKNYWNFGMLQPFGFGKSVMIHDAVFQAWRYFFFPGCDAEIPLVDLSHNNGCLNRWISVLADIIKLLFFSTQVVYLVFKGSSFMTLGGAWSKVLPLWNSRHVKQTWTLQRCHLSCLNFRLWFCVGIGTWQTLMFVSFHVVSVFFLKVNKYSEIWASYSKSMVMKIFQDVSNYDKTRNDFVANASVSPDYTPFDATFQDRTTFIHHGAYHVGPTCTLKQLKHAINSNLPLTACH